MWQMDQVKKRGREAFKANYWPCVLVSFIVGLVYFFVSFSIKVNNGSNMGQSGYHITATQGFTTASAISGIAIAIFIIKELISVFLYNPLCVGGGLFFKENVLNQENSDTGLLKEGFSPYGHIVLTLFLRDLFIILWTLCFIIPGIIALYSYRMIPYILKDKPELSPMEAIKESKRMMEGHRLHAFAYDLSFIGWALLAVLTCGIVGVFWYGPYRMSSNAALYLTLRDSSNYAEY